MAEPEHHGGEFVHRSALYPPQGTRQYSPKWPDGKKHSRNVYAHTREECEEKLKVLIVEMKAEIAEAKRLMDLGKGDGSPPEEKKGKREKARV